MPCVAQEHPPPAHTELSGDPLPDPVVSSTTRSCLTPESLKKVPGLLVPLHPPPPEPPLHRCKKGSLKQMHCGAARDALEGGEATLPPRGAQPTPSHCPPDGKCQLQWHL